MFTIVQLTYRIIILKLRVLLFIAASMLCGVNSVQGMKRTTTERTNLCDLELGSQESDSANLGLNIVAFSNPEPCLITLISGMQLHKKLNAKQLSLQQALKVVAFRQKNRRKILYRQHQEAARNRVASERLVVKD